ncbi:MAG: cytochrome c [Candidatus Poribacteria bacterium]|nr:cytochrome c [Candidatus Poribacteria bacterium]MDE0503116.1 cytochrome c [Candidatus Poribacteria bacterium]
MKKMAISPSVFLACQICLFLIIDCLVFAQGTPRINALFPAGGQVGTTVDVTVHGADLAEAHTLIIEGDTGITGELFDSSGEADTTHQALFEASCTQCHELRSPSNRSMAAAQWEATVDNMIEEKDAPISVEDRDKIVSYLKSAVAASGGLTLRLSIPPDTPPGAREIRVVGKFGASSAWPFEISEQVEEVELEPNSSIDDATPVETPIVINGLINSHADADYFQFDGYEGDRFVFEVRAFRLNNASQQFFYPVITLYDSDGDELARNTGFYVLDPLIDYTLPADGTYYLGVRDLLFGNNPASVYRLSMGTIPYNTYVFPPAGTIGTTVNAVIGGENLPDVSATDPRASLDIPIDLTTDQEPGLGEIHTPFGSFPFVSSLAPESVELAINDPVDTTPEPVETTDTDIEGQILFGSKCSQCHELRSPDNQPLSADEWQSTIMRMIAKDNANISMEEAERIIAYVQAETQRLAAIMAKQLESAQEIVVSGGVSGRISEPGDVDYYKFDVSEGQTLGPWWVIQPFDNYNETGFDVVYPPEVEIDLEKEYVGKGRRTIGWYKSTGVGNTVFSNVPEDDVVGYALTYLESDRERTEILSLASDDGIKVWVNDKLIWSHHVHRPIRSADDVIALPLSKGRNKILLKIENGFGPWGFLASIGGYSIDLSAERLGSPFSPSLTLVNSRGEVLANNAGVAGGRDARIDFSFPEPGVYMLRVEDITGAGGAEYIYHLGVEPTRPDFSISVTPDNPNIGRGGTVVLTVTADRRVGFSSEILLDVENLPPGVTASSGAILKEMADGIITLTAAPDAPLDHRVVQVVGSVMPLTGELVKRAANPVEFYRLANQLLSVQRSSVVVSVTEPPNVILSVSPENLSIAPETPVPLTVTAQRKPGSKQILSLALIGLPPGIRTQQLNTILGGDQTEATIVIEPNIVGFGITARENPFVGRELATLPYNVVVTASVGQRIVASSPPAKLTIGTNESGAQSP